jgi:hypothetical protein
LLKLESVFITCRSVGSSFHDAALTTDLCYQEENSSLSGEELVYNSKNNVLIETLPTGSLGLPTVAEPTYTVQRSGVGKHLCKD